MNTTKKSSANKSIALAVGGAFLLSVGTASFAAGENPFAIKSLSSGYQVAEADAKKMKDGKCGTGKCGANKKKATEKAADGKCSAEMKGKEGSCSADKAKEGSCSAEKAAEGKCSAEMMKEHEGKCSAEMKGKEGACHADKK